MQKPCKKAPEEPAARIDMKRCYLCAYEMIYPNIKEPKPESNHIIGRSANGGHICRSCYEQGEHSHNVARDEFLAWHQGDMWASLHSAACHLESKDDRRDILKLLRKQLTGGFGIPLPYDPTATAEEIEAGTDAQDAQRVEEMKARVRRAVESYHERN